jgi:hypothetical protein
MDRCFFTRLGSSSERSSDFRHLESQGKELSNKMVGKRAIQLALIYFEDILQRSRVLLRCDNFTGVSYFNREGGTKSFQLCCLILEIFQWSKSRDIVIRTAHIPGKNVLADDL